MASRPTTDRQLQKAHIIQPIVKIQNSALTEYEINPVVLNNRGLNPRIRKLANKVWIERKLMGIIHHALVGMPERRETRIESVKGRDVETEIIVEQSQPRNHQLAMNALMNLARLKGYVVEQKKSVSAKLDMSKMNHLEIREMLGAKLNELEPGARAKIERLAEGTVLDGEAAEVESNEG